MTWHRIIEATEETRGRVNRGALNIVEKVQDVTGLKLRETLAFGDEARKRAEEKVAEAQEIVGEVTEEVKASASQKVEEIKEAVQGVEKDVEQDSTRVETEKGEAK
jgi:organizing structure protein 2